MELSEPRPVMRRPREAVIADRVNPGAPTGSLVLADIYEGRNMKGVKRGDIRKLLVLETLPMPIHYTGGMDPLSYGGTFTLERIVGTVPVEPDGSAYLELPAAAQFLLRGAGRKRFFGEAHAEFSHRAARRNHQLHRLPRAAHPHAGQRRRHDDGAGAAPASQPHRAHRRRAGGD